MEFTKVTNNLEGDLDLTWVYLWDKGPKKPSPPQRPDLPKGKIGDPEFDLAMIEFKEFLEDYERALKAYSKAKDDYAKWHKDNGGPFEIKMYSVNATEALQRDPDRYCVSAKTRGHGSRTNQGLPDGMKPGRAHFENLARIAAGESDMEQARRSDPVFGDEVRI